MHYRNRTARVIAIMICCAWSFATPAQTVYRCGNSYSQTACAGAVAVAVDDSRSPAQKAQTDAATVQARQLASQMERERLASEQTARSAQRRQNAAKGQDRAKVAAKVKLQADASATNKPSRASEKTTKKNKDPEFFTAAAAAPDKKSKPAAGATD